MKTVFSKRQPRRIAVRGLYQKLYFGIVAAQQIGQAIIPNRNHETATNTLPQQVGQPTKDGHNLMDTWWYSLRLGGVPPACCWLLDML